ncbi:LysR family transcriptional regulator [Fusibacter ferrireducens]|uniref:LysR family transcriptional regulator n=1 Tax=Fusibacter ferrireducens TaxID=2785058 RepID=A0ABR9ZNT4_9FIRM|nr:LysR family transcriptional regulator [Fusibacter ferrireducens]MBF4692127.1 LysR family transcriptional regulator [Fusibacter ferrireducens]
MDLKDLSIIENLYTTKCISKTSENLYLTQPAITLRIKRLEQEFSIKLINRHPNGITFTKAGTQIHEFSQKFLKAYEALRLELNTDNDSISGNINVCVGTTFAKYFLAPLIREFKNIYPNIVINLFTIASRYATVEKLKENNIDLSLIRTTDPTIYTQNDILFEEPYGIISQKPINDFSKLNETNFIANNYTNIDFLKNWWENKFSRIFDGPIVNVDSSEAIMSLISQDLGWSMLPIIHISHYKSLYFYPFFTPDNTNYLLMNVLVCNKTPTNAVTELFVEFLKKHAKTHAQQLFSTLMKSNFLCDSAK